MKYTKPALSLVDQADLLISRGMLPTPAIARRFDDLTGPLMAKIKSNSKESKSLATLRDTLLPKLLIGELSKTKTYVEKENRL
jgi:type I restriction enzyme S subunit